MSKVSIGAVCFGRVTGETFKHETIMGAERYQLLQRVANGEDSPDGLILLNYTHGGFKRMTASEINWNTSSIKPAN